MIDDDDDSCLTLKANRERIIACINFLAGVPQHVLDALLKDHERWLAKPGVRPDTKATPVFDVRKHIQRWYDLNPHLWEKDNA